MASYQKESQITREVFTVEVVVTVIGVLLIPILAWRLSCHGPMFVLEIAQFFEGCRLSGAAEQFYRLALHIARSTDWAYPRSRIIQRSITPLPIVLKTYSTFYFKLGKYDKSFELEQERLRLFEADRDLESLAEVSSELAVSYMMSGDLDKALHLSERSIIAMEAAYRGITGDKATQMAKMLAPVKAASLGSAMFGRAWVLETLRLYEQAEPIRTRILEITETQFGKEAFVITTDLNRLGNLYRLQGRLDEAEEPLRRCLELRQKIRSSPTGDINRRLCTDELIASAQQAIGNLLLDRGDITGACSLVEESYSTIEKLYRPDNPAHAEHAVSLGRLRCLQGAARRAWLFSNERLKLCKKNSAKTIHCYLNVWRSSWQRIPPVETKAERRR